jgi:trehalose-phosphatase
MTPHLSAAWPALARRLRREPRLVVFTDFDGTLAPIRLRAEAARLSVRVRAALARLAGDGHLVAIVSGRPLADLEPRVGLAGLWYAGSHGYFLRAPDGSSLSLLRPAEAARLAGVARRIAAQARRLPGLRVERKPGAVALHYRGAPPASRAAAASLVRRLAGATPGVRVLHGRAVWELLPAGPVDKYLAARFILRAGRKGRVRHARWPIYLGDDGSDERVFARWHGVSVAVGRSEGTAARYYVRSPGEVCGLLERLAQLQGPPASF